MEHQGLLITLILLLSVAAYVLSKRISPKIDSTFILVFETENNSRFELAQQILHTENIAFNIKTTKDPMLPIGSFQIWVNSNDAESAKTLLSNLS